MSKMSKAYEEELRERKRKQRQKADKKRQERKRKRLDRAHGTYMAQNRRRVYDPKMWKPGEPLTKEDQKLLEEVRRRYEELGRVPTKSEVATTDQIRQRFRTWGDTLLAAGLREPKERKRKKDHSDKKQKDGEIHSEID